MCATFTRETYTYVYKIYFNKKLQENFLKKLPYINLLCSEFPIKYNCRLSTFYQKFIKGRMPSCNDEDLKKILDKIISNMIISRTLNLNQDQYNFQSNIYQLFYSRCQFLSKKLYKAEHVIINDICLAYKKKYNIKHNACYIVHELPNLKSIVHGDLVIDNIIINDHEDKVYFIDYESMYVNDITDDLSFLQVQFNINDEKLSELILESFIKHKIKFNKIDICNINNSIKDKHFFAFGCIYLRNEILSLICQKEI